MTSQPLTEQQLADIAARAEAATPGPWCTDDWEIYQGTEYQPGLSMWIGETCRGITSPEQDRADATFVAHARTDVPALLAENQRLKAELADFSGRVNELESQMCNCQPVREHDDLKRAAFYQHEPHCHVNAPTVMSEEAGR